VKACLAILEQLAAAVRVDGGAVTAIGWKLIGVA
jgi:hypothetical protein